MTAIQWGKSWHDFSPGIVSVDSILAESTDSGERIATGTFGNLGRNAFRAPSHYDLDASVSRQFPIHERLAFNLRLEAFNVLNHPNLNGFTTTLSSSTFGFATTTQPARIFQLAGKFTF